jgi:hypothetical protein
MSSKEFEYKTSKTEIIVPFNFWDLYYYVYDNKNINLQYTKNQQVYMKKKKKEETI